nr:hypothetical protein [Tanacetum cinerariifolium]
MTGNLKPLCNFVEKYMGIVRFGNDQFAPILSYGDLVQGNITINRIYYIEGLNHNLFSVGQFYDVDLELAFRKSTCFVIDLQALNAFFKEEGIEHQTSTPRTPEQNGVIKRQNNTLVEAARMMLSGLLLFFWAEAIATTCYTQNRSIIIPTHEKTSCHIINDRNPSIKHLHIFGCTCYLTKDGENIDKMKEIGDPCILMRYFTQSKGYRVYNKRTILIVESIHLRFDEIKEMSVTSVDNDTSGLNGNSFKLVPRTTANADGTSTLTIPDPVTTKEKAQKKNAVKARSMLLMALLNEHLLIFSQYKDSKTLFETIHARFGGNDATKKSQRTLLKQLYDNFNAPSTESLDSIFNRLQKIKNKADLDTMSIDDLYNNFKIVEEEVKRTVTSSSSSRSKNMAFLSSLGSTNEVDTASIQVSTVSTPVST